MFNLTMHRCTYGEMKRFIDIDHILELSAVGDLAIGSGDKEYVFREVPVLKLGIEILKVLSCEFFVQRPKAAGFTFYIQEGEDHHILIESKGGILTLMCVYDGELSATLNEIIRFSDIADLYLQVRSIVQRANWSNHDVMALATDPFLRPLLQS